MGPHKGAAMNFQPRIRKGAFFDAAWKHGCRTYSVYNRTYISSTFSDALTEYWNVINNVGIWPAMGERQIEVTGPDAQRFVQYLTPRNMTKCAVNQCKYALITSAEGGIVCDPIILRLDEDRFWLSTSDVDLELWMRGVLVNAGMDVRIRDAEVSVVQVQGPKSPKLLAGIFGEQVLDLRYYWLTRVAFEGAELIVSRTGWSGEFGYEIYLADAKLGTALFDALLEAGEDCGAAPGAVNHIRRIESGILSQGLDMTVENTPYELGLGRLVNLEAGTDFIGRAALEKLQKEAPALRLVGLRLDGDPIPPNEEVWPLMSDGNAVGNLTSLAFSPRLGCNIALGLVATDCSTIGNRMTVTAWRDERSAIVCELPFLPKKQSEDPRALFARAG
ncbi:MAG: glycine cleavage T C-terminal barrel domain-containing protein [Pseudomonadota bacterium]